MATSNTPAQFAYDTIPARVKSSVPMQVRASHISGAGRGVFVLKNVEENGLIFAIPNPVLTIIARSLKDLDTCDNCFAIGHSSHRTVQRLNLDFKKCDGCEVLSYCSQECKDQAWKKHHKYECTTLKAIKDCTASVAQSEALQSDVRCVIRLIQLRNNGKISNSVWAEIKALGTCKGTGATDPQFGARMTRIADIVLQFIEPKETNPMQSREEIMHLANATTANREAMLAPVLNTVRVWEPVSIWRVPIGWFVDPFYSMINHCCEANAMLFQEGREVRLKAIRDLVAGEEIVISYCYFQSGDKDKRKLELKERFAIDCKCKLCKRSVLIPDEGPLRNMAFQTAQLLLDDPVTAKNADLALPVVARSIAKMDEEGLPAETHPYLGLYRGLLDVHLCKQDRVAALKTCLKLYFVIEPADLTCAVSYEDRINTLFVLVSLLGSIPSYHGDEGVMNNISRATLPEPIRILARQIFPHLREKVTRDIQNYFGTDTEIAQWNKHLLLQELRECKMEAKDRGFENPVSLGLLAGRKINKPECRKFLSKTNKLLVWAEIPRLTLAKLLPEIY